MMNTADIQRRILGRLEFLYGTERARGICDEILRLVARHGEKRTLHTEPWSQKDALLITYGDSVLADQAPPLSTLENFLAQNVGELVTLVHLLPFYPFTSDDGFAVTDFRAVNPALGDWTHIAQLAKRYRLVFDGVINHVSASSVYMKGCCAGDPAFADFFIALPPDTDTSKVLRTRNLPLLHDYPTRDGTKWLWTTFGRDQVDLNFWNPKVLLEILDVLVFYAERGASVIRLDAIPYLWKELGTSCAHLPQTHEIIKLIRDVYDLSFPDVLLLTETNVPHRENISYFGNGGDEAQVIYNFTLPPLVLFSLMNGDTTKLTAWAKTIEKISDRATYLNITATHDGIGVRPTEGILTEAERKQLVDLAYAHGGQVSGKRNADGTVSPYELNLNYFDAVNDPGADEPLETQIKRFMVSQAIPLAFIGIPGIYIHSLVGLRNDTQAVKDTGIARRINRAKLSLTSLRGEFRDKNSLRRRVFEEYKRLLKIRRAENAFHPNAAQDVLDLGAEVFALKRTSPEDGEVIVAIHNLSNHDVTVDLRSALRGAACKDLLAPHQAVGIKNQLRLSPYQVCWLKTTAN